MCYMNDLSANSPTDSPVNSTPLTGSPVAPMADSPITPMATRPVTSASVETVSSSPVNMVIPTAAPVDPTMAPISTTLTPVNNGSVALPTPALVLPTKAPVNPPLEPLSAASVIESPPKSDFRCGRDEEDSRTNCGKVCVYTTDCTVIGETCWGTFPNTCYTDELPVVEQTANPVSSMPLTDSPTTAVPTTLSPITSAPVKTTFAPINTSTITISPVNSTPLTDSPVTTAPTTLRPITSLPVKITFAPVKITSAPVTTTSAPVMTTSAPITLAPVTLAPIIIAPIIIADPTSGPDTEPRLCPEVPPDGCSICGEGKCVGAPDNIFEFPGQPIISCGILESVGLGGSIPLAQCEGITSIEPLKACECRDSVAPIAPTSAPVDPTSAPVDSTSAPVDPTAAPVDPTSTPVDPTSAPVDPTSAPVDITSAPVDITPAPVDPTSAPVDPTQAPISTTPVTTNDSVPPPPVLESPPRSDFRCGINEEDSRVNCGRVCIFNSDCEGGEYCWSTFPNTCYANSLPPASTQDNPPLDSENLEAISDFRCGTSEAVARGNCKSTCITQATCNLGEYCWATLPNYCHANSEGRN
eukprot:CAMPEP_0194159258 /NCGR_PEP_ID=MMETSP0152-20130528/77725_1 /TAXON_ID=1049557 /ORGANISM="Thalassiothrix antarctica, Strain L6-D1" /LENGTH=583 /DNA_ID=CAMNT_0038868801 /DNA_START=483 /DNA_END=2234 /DNA_ORIENTATION=+